MTESIYTLPPEVRLVGSWLRDLRIRRGFRQQHLVDAGVGGQGVISALENGHKMPLMHTVIAYLNAIGIELTATLVGGEPIPDVRIPLPPTRRPTGLVYRTSTRKPVPRKPKPIHKTTGTGRCLRCFKMHPGKTCSR